jgi:hypothetical protein
MNVAARPAAAAAPAAVAAPREPVTPDSATVVMKTIPPPAAAVAAPAAPRENPDATRQHGVPGKGKAEAKPAKPAPPTPPPAGPVTQPLPRPAELATPAAKPSAPAVARPARKPGSAAPLLIGGGLVLFLVLALGGTFLVLKLKGSGTKPAANNRPPATTVTAAPPVTKTSAPAAPSTIVRVTSEPAGAMIFVNNEAKGLTPLDVAGVPLGTHEVRVELAGYEPKTEAIVLSDAAPQAEVSVTLSAVATAAPALGSADIQSSPDGATVTIGRKAVGKTPLRDVKLRPGTHRVEVRKEGYEPYTGSLIVESGKTAVLSAPLKAQVAKATASPEPPKDVVDPNKVYDEGDVDQAPKRVSGPASPSFAPNLKSGERLSVSVSWVVTESGEVADPKITQSGGKGLDEAVMNMLSKQRYESGSKKGVKVKVRLLRIYTFRSG